VRVCTCFKIHQTFGRAYVLLAFISFSPRVISELRRPISVKFCTILGSVSLFSFIIPVQNLERAFLKKFRGQNMQKFGLILDDFKV